MTPSRVSPKIRKQAEGIANKYPLAAIDEARRLATESVACPFCFAKPGEPCMAIAGSHGRRELNYLDAKDDKKRRAYFTKIRKGDGYPPHYLGKAHKQRTQAVLDEQGYARVTSSVVTEK